MGIYVASTHVAVQEQINILLQPNSKELEMRWDGGQVYLGEPQENININIKKKRTSITWNT